MRGWDGGDEELGAIGVGTGVCHTGSVVQRRWDGGVGRKGNLRKKIGFVMLASEVFIGEFGAVDGFAAGALWWSEKEGECA